MICPVLTILMTLINLSGSFQLLKTSLMLMWCKRKHTMLSTELTATVRNHPWATVSISCSNEICNCCYIVTCITFIWHSPMHLIVQIFTDIDSYNGW